MSSSASTHTSNNFWTHPKRYLSPACYSSLLNENQLYKTRFLCHQHSHSSCSNTLSPYRKMLQCFSKHHILSRWCRGSLVQHINLYIYRYLQFQLDFAALSQHYLQYHFAGFPYLFPSFPTCFAVHLLCNRNKAKFVKWS